MDNSATPQDSAAMPPASSGSVSYRKRYDAAMELFWQKIGGGFFDVVAAEPAERIVEGLVDEMQSEIARLRLTDAERGLLEHLASHWEDMVKAREWLHVDTVNLARGRLAIVRGLLERLG